MATPILEAISQGMALTDIAAAVVTTATKSYLIKTATEAGIKARVDSGKKTVLRKGNVIHAQNNTDDVILGYDIDLTDCLMHPELVALIDGGAVVNGESGSFESYTGPVIGQETVHTKFTLDVYCAVKDTGSNITAYQKLSFTGCKGKSPLEWSVKDGDFFTPKYTIETAPAFGDSPMTMEVVTTLPTVA